MKFTISTAALLLVLGTTASVYARQEKAQQEHHEEAKPAKPEAKPPEHQQTAKPEQHEPQAKAERTQQPKPAEQHPAQKPAQTRTQSQQHPVTQAQQNGGGRSQPRTGQSRPASKGNYAHGRISDAHYAASFGAEHRFHVSQGDYEHRRFQYGGYSFGFVDPWPVGWGYSDDVYVMYVDGGYYMYDPVHLGVRISINIM
jgi:hypothetical protein